MPAYDPATRRLVLVSPTTPPGSGLRAGVQSFVLTPHCRFISSWQQSFDLPDAGGPPTIAGGVAYIGSGRNGFLRAFRLSDGRPLGSHHSGAAIFAAPAVADGTLLFGDWGGRLWALRPRR
jgi:outer membrane protein assembly factor BamB